MNVEHLYVKLKVLRLDDNGNIMIIN